ncbi:MAG: hypothetical protein Q9180_008888, partial [Flavoplaca navasiana]
MSAAKWLGYLRWCLPRPLLDEPADPGSNEESQRVHYRRRFERLALAYLLLHLKKMDLLDGSGDEEYFRMADDAATQLHLELQLRHTVHEGEPPPWIRPYNRDDPDERREYEDLYDTMVKKWILRPLANARLNWDPSQSATAHVDDPAVSP